MISMACILESGLTTEPTLIELSPRIVNTSGYIMMVYEGLVSVSVILESYTCHINIFVLIFEYFVLQIIHFQDLSALLSM